MVESLGNVLEDGEQRVAKSAQDHDGGGHCPNTSSVGKLRFSARRPLSVLVVNGRDRNVLAVHRDHPKRQVEVDGDGLAAN
jgi:hypothetical protein